MHMRDDVVERASLFTGGKWEKERPRRRTRSLAGASALLHCVLRVGPAVRAAASRAGDTSQRLPLGCEVAAQGGCGSLDGMRPLWLAALAWLGVLIVPSRSVALQEDAGVGSVREQLTCGQTAKADCVGNDIGNNGTKTFADCCDLCHKTPGCTAFSLDHRSEFGRAIPTCYMKSSCASTKASNDCDAGTTSSGPPQKPPAPAPPSPPVPALPPVPPPPPMQPLPWSEATALAKKMLAKMNQTEKFSMMKQVGWIDGAPEKWWYIGNIPAIPRLNIPSLNMQDAAGGFRTSMEEIVGTVTCWPSLLSMAATFDLDVMRKFSLALGAEFAGKGANFILGPSINTHRIAKGGRNFEYLSGEDPYLGAKLTAEYVKGVQEMGVATVTKHYLFNNQETNRNSENSIVDDKTAWELYYPPFQAAVDAGGVGFMCSYNQEDGEWSCTNSRRLKADLKGAMGFQGLVQSDWGAGHGTTVKEGLDMDMPMSATPDFSPTELNKVAPADIDDAVTRTPPHCEGWLRRNVTGVSHRAVAREGAAASIVLLQNNGSLLPLTTAAAKPYTIAVLGGAAEAKVFDANLPGGGWCTNRQGQPGGDITCGGDYYSGGGSGHVTPAVYSTPLDGIKNRASFGPSTVTVKSHSTGSSNKLDAENLALAKAADVTIVFCGASTGESADRQSLSLDADCDRFISAVAKVAQHVVVLVMAPGAFLTPWRSEVSTIAAMFLGGQETGGAWADVVFGDVSPAGRLPIELPATEADTIEPNPAPSVPYTEGLQTSYRNTTATRAYPFGHGLSFSTFLWSDVSSTSCPTATPAWEFCLTVTVTNTGLHPATDTPQLYLEFPPEAGHPRSILKGFQKTPLLEPMISATVAFNLTARDLSYYVPQSKSWVKAAVAKVSYELSKSSEEVVMRGTLGELQSR